VSTGKVDEDALDAGIKAFAAGFQVDGAASGAEEPTGGAADADTAKVTSPVHLPEDETTIVEDED